MSQTKCKMDISITNFVAYEKQSNCIMIPTAFHSLSFVMTCTLGNECCYNDAGDTDVGPRFVCVVCVRDLFFLKTK